MKKTLIVLVIALVFLGGILLKNRSNTKQLSSDSPVFDSTQSQLAKWSQIIKGGDTSTLKMQDAKWLVASDSFSVDTSKINKLLHHIFTLQNGERVSNSPARYAEYGLDSIEARHILIKDGSAKTLADVILGKTSGADYSSTYWRWADKPDVYRTPGNFSWEIPSKESDWKDKKLFQVLPKDLKIIQVVWTDSTKANFAFKLESTSDTSWKMLEPQDSARVKNPLALDMASKFSEILIDDFVTKGDTNITKVKLDTHAVWVKVTLKIGIAYELKGTLVMGGYSYTQHPTRKDIVKLSSWRYDAFKKKPFELLDAPPAPAPVPAAGSTPAVPAVMSPKPTAPALKPSK